MSDKIGEQWATRNAFFVAGFCMSAWAPLVPYAKERLALNEGQLGLLLLCAGTGGVLAMPFAGGLAGRFGCRRVVITSGSLMAAAVPLLAWVPSAWMLAATQLWFGAMLGITDVTMNINAVLVERRSGRAMMSGFHGLWSVGGIAGAGLMGLLVKFDASLLQAAFAVQTVSLVLLWFGGQWLLPYGSDKKGPAFAVPHGAVILLGCFCFILFLAEGSVLDWSGVFLRNVRHVDEASVGLGYIAFSATMTIFRLIGDPIVNAVGAKRIVVLGGLCAAGGMMLAILSPWLALGIVGWALVGVGAANAVPVMFSAVGKQESMPFNLALPAVTTLGYAGTLVGPALVGFVANAFGLTIGLTVVAVMLVGVSFASLRSKL